MMNGSQTSGFYIFVTFLAALILTLLPMPTWAMWLRPAWTLMVLIYWGMMIPDRVNVGTAWCLGIFLDVLEGTILGEHALALTIVMFLVVRIHTRLRMFPLLQQGISVFFLVWIYQFILFCIQGFLGMLPASWLYWSSAFTSMLLWPWVLSIMRGRTEVKI